jgi:surface carbohydrate biosynthesis protein
LRGLRVVLVVDNPLRDLDGLIRLGWVITQRGGEAWLAPMYDQAFIVEKVRPDVVVSNYIRGNNTPLLERYRVLGVRNVIVDTEGIAGQRAEGLADLVGSVPVADLVDAYCVWGPRQRDSFIQGGILPPERLVATGCPRYDYAANPWRDALPSPAEEPGFILINTNFSMLAPRFSAGPESERKTLLSVGIPDEQVDQRMAAERLSRRGMIDLVAEMSQRLSDIRFVLRPHPFERVDVYDELSTLPNVSVRQEGTSLEWLNCSAGLLHLNCSTAVEAAMLGKHALSPAWLDHPAIHIEGPASVSEHLPDAESMIVAVSRMAAGTLPANLETVMHARRIIAEGYLAIDGKACDRIADAIEATLATPSRLPAPRPRLKARLRPMARRLLGPLLWRQLHNLVRPGLKARYDAKAFGLEHVQPMLIRLSTASDRPAPVAVMKSISAGLKAIRIQAPGR